MPITRRTMLGLMSSSSFFLTASPGVAAQLKLADDLPALKFPQGVASADPQPDAVMLWTRAEPADGAGSVKFLLQVSTAPDFSDILLESLLSTDQSSDYTVRAYVDGLTADTAYFYRFLGPGDSQSRPGRTRTAPAPDQEQRVCLAFASCQSFEQGYYGSWARMLEDDSAAEDADKIQFVLFLGDFIYERSWNKGFDDKPQPRYVPEFPLGVKTAENRHAVSLSDYRHLYKTYLTDPWLQTARARWPFISIWDDHEFCNDNFQSYSTYGEEPTLEPRRKQSANQAWFEYIPSVLQQLNNQPAHDFQPTDLTGTDAQANSAARDSLCIYRKLGWGKFLDVVLTDSRSYRSPPCLPDGLADALGLPMNTVTLVDIADGGRDYNGGNPPEVLPYGDNSTPNPNRNRAPGTCLGDTQRGWFLDTLRSSEAHWKLWGNSLPLIPMRLDLSSLPFTDYEDSILTIDPWAGYPSERNLLMDELTKSGITGVVSLSGDHHMHGAGTLRSMAPHATTEPAAVDFSCAGISSTPFFDNIAAIARKGSPSFQPLVYKKLEGAEIPVWNMTMLHGVLASYVYSNTGFDAIARWLGPSQCNPGLKYVDTTANGYGLAQFGANELRIQMITMEDTRIAFDTPPEIKHIAKFRLPRWRPGESPNLKGPEFEKGQPFPFQQSSV
jgi:alkaline phosphatase D